MILSTAAQASEFMGFLNSLALWLATVGPRIRQRMSIREPKRIQNNGEPNTQKNMKMNGGLVTVEAYGDLM